MFTGKINEFINWSTGVDERTDLVIEGVSPDNKISGESIRKLITSHLQKPFVTIKDEVGGVIRIFSSSDVAEEWWKYANPDKENYAYNPEKALEIIDAYLIWEIELPATYAITGPEDLGSTRYIIEGNSSSQNAVLLYTLGLKDSLGNTPDDTISVTYTIKDSSENIVYNEKILYDTGFLISKNIYQYLRSGDNTIIIYALSNNYNAKTSKTLHIYLVNFLITSNFSGYYQGVSRNRDISFDVSIYRSITKLNIETKVFISEVGGLVNLIPASVWPYNESSATPSHTFNIPSSSYLSSFLQNGVLYDKKYRMVIQAFMNDAENGVTFNSNVLIYEFEIASNDGEVSNVFVNCSYSVSSSDYIYLENGSPVLLAKLYVPFLLDWGYYSDSENQSDVAWYLRTREEGYYEYKELVTILGVKGIKPDTLTFISNSSCNYATNNSFLVAKINNEIVSEYPINISENSIDVLETDNYTLKLLAYGKTNSSDSKDSWIDYENNITTTFSPGVTFDSRNGWDNNSLVLRGIDSYATVNYNPFPNRLNGDEYIIGDDGCSFEIDFKPELVDNDNDIILTIGDPNSGRIVITPTSASFYDGSNALIIKTNLKTGERVQLCFVFNKTSDYNTSNLLYIINNGILERVAVYPSSKVKSAVGNIKIGGSRSSIRVYSIRAYRKALLPKEALNNYMFDNIEDSLLISRNNIYGDSSSINYRGMQGKLDIIIIEGNLYPIFHNKDSKENATVKITRESNIDPSKDFEITDCRIRNHGLSTLSYPITSMKIWFNKSNRIYEENGVLKELIPSLVCSSLQYLNLNKNRYIMKTGGIPANKFVLQANYADSSGSHNGSLLRLINDTWYNALIDGEFKLRTAPLLFSSGAKITHGNVNLGEPDLWKQGKIKVPAVLEELYTAEDQEVIDHIKEIGDVKVPALEAILYTNEEIEEHNAPLIPLLWKEGYYNIDSSSNGYDYKKEGKTWPEITGSAFPYKIRNAADSFPCTVFYRDTSSDNLELTLLGLYVFMDDKKSDFIYGERSIYCDLDSEQHITNADDPFCLRIPNKSKDTNSNKVWDNSKVLRIEVVYPNSPLTSYNTRVLAESYTLDENDNLIPAEGATHQFNETYYTLDEKNRSILTYYWELHFELIYPDKEDFIKNDVFLELKFVNTVTPFISFMNWITSVADRKNDGPKLGLTGSLARVTQSELNKFIEEAHNHLDLYKLAAYYIFFLRFGLIDSVERNAQLKTYDGQHWHYEPWDMDIALGCANNGVIAYEPPLTRDTLAGGSTYAFSGRTATQSNVLWDCLECWDYWANTLVPEVANALYDAGLTYENAILMFDEEYVNKWSETLYNESGKYKYIDATLDPQYRLYLNGARTSHRHWWLSKSMNYYDAKWSCGDFTKHSIVFRIGKSADISNSNLIKIYPTSNTFFKMQYGDKGGSNVTPIGGLTEATVSPGGEAVFDALLQLEDKLPCIIFGASSIEELDLSGLLEKNSPGSLGRGYTNINLGGSYDNVLGAPIKRLKLGAKCTPSLYEYPNATSYLSNLTIWQNTISGVTDDRENDALENLELLDVVGWYNQTTSGERASWLTLLFKGTGYDRKNIKTLYAMGCNMATEFKTSNAGNNFTDIRLPNSVTSLEFSNSSWEDISFWSYTSLGNLRAQYDKLNGIPASVASIKFTGSTARNQCSLDMVLSWINNIEAEIALANPGYTSEELETALLTALGTKTIYAELINWGTGTTKIYYKDLVRLSHIGNEGNLNNLKGYAIISDLTPLTSVQLANLLNLYGDYVFSVGTTNSNLVVDQSLGYVRISIMGELVDGLEDTSTISTINGELYINEPYRANLRATSFSLKSDTSTNIIIDDVNGGLSFLEFEINHPLNTYLWTVSDTEDNRYGLTNTYKSVKLEKRANGSVRITTSEGDFGNYYFYINVYYYDLNLNNEFELKSDSVKINVIGVTYPTGYSFSFTPKGNSGQPRKFLCNNDIALDIFGLQLILSGIPDSYVLYDNNLKVEVSIVPQGTYTSTLKEIRYFLEEIGGTNANSGWLTKELITTGDNTLNLLGTSLERALGYTKEGTTGIVIQVNGVPPSERKIFKLTIEITIGGKNPFTRNIFFIVWEDNTVMISLNTNDGRYNAFVDLYTTNYSQWGSRGVYKSDLLSLYGVLDFSSFSLQTLSVLTTSNNPESIFLYTPNISGIILDGCSSVPLMTGQTLQLNLSNIPNLLSLSVKGCTGLIGLLDLTSNYLLESLDTRNIYSTNNGTTNLVNSCSVGVKLVNSRATSVLLGSPTEITIIRPLFLGDSGTTFSIDSKSNLNTIELNEINTSNVHSFSILNTILSTS